MKKGKASKIRKYVATGMLITSLLLIMISVSYSWFINNNKMQSWEISAEVVQAQNLLVKDGNNTYAKSLDIEYPEGLELSPVCGNGKSFYKPIFTKQDPDGDGVYEYLPSGYEALTQEKMEQSVLSFEISFHVDYNVDLYLNINPSINQKYSSIKKSDKSIDSAYGDFSAGYITGALRIAIYHWENGEYHLGNIWIPDPDTRLMTAEDGTLYIATGEDSQPEEYYTFANSTDTESAFKVYTNGEKNGAYTDGATGITYTWGTENDIKITHVENGGQNDLKFVIWVDGLDSECHNALIGGTVDINLMFDVR